jgi:hypothetical protein
MAPYEVFPLKKLTLARVFAVAAITFSLAGPAQAQTVTTLANFNGTDGAKPYFDGGSKAQTGISTARPLSVVARVLARCTR